MSVGQNPHSVGVTGKILLDKELWECLRVNWNHAYWDCAPGGVNFMQREGIG
jgi:hypothetical protein